MELLFIYIKNSLDNVTFLTLILGLLFYWINVAFSKFTLSGNLGFCALAISNLFLALILGERWLENGYFPLSNLYESLLFFAWGITFFSLILEFLTSLKLVGAVITPLAMFVIGFATLSLPDGMQKAAPLVPALKSNWLMMHVSIMMISYSTLIVGSLLSILFLVLTRGKSVELQGNSIGLQNSKKVLTSSMPVAIENILSLQPSLDSSVNINLGKKLNLLESLDNLSYRIIGLGFPLLTLGIIAGAVWANEAWGSYWSWDPKETWAFITWLVFAAYLHTRITKSWQGKGPAILASVGFVVVWICYLGVNFLGKGLHSYGWIL
jgi:cytochrome c-type biogenesis protein CcsB